jgi:hypothetical protein
VYFHGKNKNISLRLCVFARDILVAAIRIRSILFYATQIFTPRREKIVCGATAFTVGMTPLSSAGVP